MHKYTFGGMVVGLVPQPKWAAVHIASMLLLVAGSPSRADLEIGQYWHSEDTGSPPTYFSNYSAAVSAMTATDGETQYMELEESASSVGAGKIGDRYGIPNTPVLSTEWTYIKYYSTDEFETEQELIDSYVADHPDSDAQCAPKAWSYLGGWTATSMLWGESTVEHRTIKVTREVYNSYHQQCFENAVNSSLRRDRESYCEGPRAANGGGGGYACVNNREATVYGRPVTAAAECRGNPCNVATGDKVIREVDYVGVGIEFVRTFHSAGTDRNTRLGTNWTHSYGTRLVNSHPTYMAAILDTGFQEAFYKISSAAIYGSQTDSGLILRKDSGTGEWELHEPSGDKKIYNDDGVLLRLVSANGQTTTVTRDGSGRVDYVTGPFGHMLDFVYDGNGQLDKLIDPSGNDIEFDYATAATTGKPILQSVTYQDASSRTYLYEYTDAIRDTLISGIKDENEDRYATYGYDSDGLVTSSEHAGAKDKITLSYGATTTQVVESGGSTTNYVFSTDERLPRKIVSRTEAGATKSTTFAPFTQDWSRNRPTQITDELGNVSKFTYSNARTESKTEAFGTAQARTTNYEYLWYRDARPTTIKTPSVKGSGYKEIVTAYDSSQRPISVSMQGFKPNGTAVSRTATFTYNTAGQVLTVNGPRTDVSDITTFDYYDCTTGDECGQLESITNALSQVTTFDSYDAHGRLLEMTDPNGLTTTITYDLRGRILTITETPVTGSARIMTNGYDDAGQLTSVSAPDGMELTYEYDAAHDLISITDNLGNSIEYDYDSRGNRIEEDVYDPSSVLTRAVDYTYDLKNRIDTVNEGGFATDMLFDALGNLEEETDPTSATTEHSYDALNRLIQTVDALSGVTDYAYNVNDNLISVTTANGASTVYEYDDLGNLLKEVSADRGTTTYTHDAAGNVVTSTDARGKVTTYTYDALNRVTEIELDNSDSIAFQYDTGTSAIGRLNKITDPSGETTWTYNNFGQVTGKSHKIGTVTLTNAYGYDASGRLTTMTLPSGKVVTYGYTDHLPVSVTVDSTTILSGATYDPFGPANGWTWGNSTSHSRSFDLRGLLDSQSMVTDTRTLTYDDAGRLTTLDDARHDLGFDYDSLGQLTDFTKSGSAPLPATQYFSYDENGNRESITENGTPYSYTNVAYSNRLTSTTGPTAKSLTYDGAGNVTSDGIHSYAYDDRSRLVSVDSGAVTYQHNGQGQRVKKDDGTTVTLFAYDETGHLVGEYDGSGNPIQETVWFNGAPVAVLIGSNEYYIHTDHLGTPRLITDGNTIIWRWESDPFGTTTAQEDPDGDLTDFTYNLRFPGQYYDEETGLHYNYYRTYDPSTGRYLESDPIGLLGGLNTYSYVSNMPTMQTDRYGLFEVRAHHIKTIRGVETQFYIDFNPLSERPGDIALRMKKTLHRLNKLLEMIDTPTVGPRRPLDDLVECGLLDAKLQHNYKEWFRDKREDQLSRDELLNFLNAQRDRYPEMRDLYGRPENMLDQAVELANQDPFYKHIFNETRK
jgi:RHS repeat-associated protein